MDDNMGDGSESDINKSNEHSEITSHSKGVTTNDRGNEDVAIPIDDTAGVTSVDESRTNPVPNLNNETDTSANTCLSSRVNNKRTNLRASHEVSANRVIDEDANLVTDACMGNGHGDFDERSDFIFLESGEVISDRTAEAVNSIVVSNATELTSISELSINDENQSHFINDQESPRKTNLINSSESLSDHRLNNENLVRNSALRDSQSHKNTEDLSSENLNFVNNVDDSVRGDDINKNITNRSKDHEGSPNLNLIISADLPSNQSLNRSSSVKCNALHDSGTNEGLGNAESVTRSRPVADRNLSDGRSINATILQGNQSSGHRNSDGSGSSSHTNGTVPSADIPDSALRARNLTPVNLDRRERKRKWLFIKYWAMRDKVVMLLQSLVGPSSGRQQWKRPLDSNMSLAAYAVGLANILRFPYLMIKHGGASFLISYGVSLVVIGFPLYMVDISLAQYLSLGPTSVYSSLAPMFSGLGWAMIATAFFVSIYYSVVLSWILVYLYQSFAKDLPWKNCNSTREECDQSSENNTITAAEKFFHFGVLQESQEGQDAESHEGQDADDAPLSAQLVVCLGCAWLAVVLSLIRRNPGNANCVTNAIPYAVLLLLLIWSCAGKGSEACKTAFQSFLYTNQNPDAKSTLMKTGVWIDAASQMLFSLGHALGGHATLASYNNLHQNTLWSSIVVVLWDTATSVLCSCIVYTSVCQAVHKCYPFVHAGEVAFIAYSVLLVKVDVHVWPILFFLVLFTLGIGSLIGFVETITTALFNKFSYLQSRYFPFIVMSCFLLFVLGLPMCSSKGIYQVELMHMYTCKVSILVLGLLQVILVGYIFGFQKFMKLVREELKVSVPVVVEWYLAISLKLLVPAAFSVLLLVTLLYDDYISTKDKEDSETYTHFGLILPITSCLFVPGFAVYELYKNKDKNWQELLKPTPEFRPAHQRQEDTSSFILNEGSEYSISSSVHAAGGLNPYITISSITEMFRWSRNWLVDNGTGADRAAAQGPQTLQINRILDTDL